jgi:signal transduction histidine kinase
MKSLGVLSSGLAHDFKNVLSTIKGFMQFILMKKAVDPDINDGARIVDGEITKGSYIVDKLMNFARKIDLNKNECSMSELIHDAMDSMIHIVPEIITIDIHIDKDMPTIQIDPYYLDQVIKNLVINAIDAMTDGGRITINSCIAAHEEVTNLDEKRIDGELIKIAVSDTGKGIEKENLNNVFDPFYTTKAQGKGSGLGLAMAYGIVKEHGGYITVDSREGEGTMFTIFLPVSDKTTNH